MNNVNQSGILGREIQLSKTNNGNSVCNFSISVYIGKDGNGNSKTKWFHWRAWGWVAERLSKAKVGDTLIVSGFADVDEYRNKDGIDVQRTVFVANDGHIEPKYEANYDVPDDGTFPF